MAFERKQKEEPKYTYSSSFKKRYLFDAEGKAPEIGYMEPGVTEEIAFNLTKEKAEEFINKIIKAAESEEGDGGIRFTVYMKQGHNQATGETFDSATVLVVPKNKAQRPPQQSFGGKQQQGRRDYPKTANPGTEQSGHKPDGQSTVPTIGGQSGPTQNATSAASRFEDKHMAEQPADKVQQFKEKAPRW